ncbi:MAG: Trm112 family protein [Planctomycetota bacterium]|jgi:uncharacterized protein YbaR (Trm112 family)|nr:Trm112 family protein [Planctomycetota bacterium]
MTSEKDTMADLPIDQDLFDLLVCPESRAPLKFVDGRLVSTDAKTRRAYRIDEGIPVMLIDESQQLDADAWQALMDADGPVGAGVEAVRARDDAQAAG